MSRPRKWTHEQVVAAAPGALCWSDLIRAVGLPLNGGSARALKKHCAEHDISTTHFLGRAKPHASGAGWNRQKLDDILVKDSAYSNSANLKDRLVKAGVLDWHCDICGLVEWCDKPITLILDHKNGNHSDNRIENLHLVCPNCDSQQPTWLGRNQGWRERQVA